MPLMTAASPLPARNSPHGKMFATAASKSYYITLNAQAQATFEARMSIHANSRFVFLACYEV